MQSLTDLQTYIRPSIWRVGDCFKLTGLGSTYGRINRLYREDAFYGTLYYGRDDKDKMITRPLDITSLSMIIKVTEEEFRERVW